MSVHEVLLRVAGRLPDDLVSEARGWLAAGHAADAAQAVAFSAVAVGTPLTEADVTALADALDGGADLLDEIPRGAEPSLPPYRMAPTGPDGLDDAPVCLDLTGDAASPDPLDGAAVVATAARAAETPVVGLWRAWRYPTATTPWPVPRRVYVLEVGAGTADDELPAIAGDLRAALHAAGEQAPQVEVVREGAEVPPYQAMARGLGALLWAPRAAVPVRVARSFDSVDPQTGPAFDDGRPRLDGVERDQVLAYLDEGEPVLFSDTTMADIIDPAQGAVVPLNLYTDGAWIWSDSVSYYLRRHGLAPDAELLEHLRSVGFALRAVDSVDLHRAMVALQSSADEPVWTAG